MPSMQGVPYKVTSVPPTQAVWPLPASSIIPHTETGLEGLGEGFNWAEDALALGAMVAGVEASAPSEPEPAPAGANMLWMWAAVGIIGTGIFLATLRIRP